MLQLRTQPTGLSRRLFIAVGIALILQSLAPAGYMHGSVAAGWPVVLCPEGLPAGFLEHPHNHHSNHNNGATDESVQYCPLGSVVDKSNTFLTSALLLADVRLDYANTTFQTTTFTRRIFRNHNPRAPPRA